MEYDGAMDVSLAATIALTGVALVAGLVDAIAGGGGLLTLPALLHAGLTPHLALGTNKGQSVFGSGAALLRFARAGSCSGGAAAGASPLASPGRSPAPSS